MYYLAMFRFQTLGHMLSHGDTGDLFVPQTPGYKETNDLVLLDNPEEIDKKKLLSQLFKDQPLERCYDAVVDNLSFKVTMTDFFVYCTFLLFKQILI